MPSPQQRVSPIVRAVLVAAAIALGGCGDADRTAVTAPDAAVPDASANATTSASAAAPVDRPARWAMPAGIDGLANAWRVAPDLLRCEQPDAAGFRAARAAGIRTVIDLRALHADDELATAAGLHCIHVRMNAWHAEDEDVVRVMAALGDSRGAPYLIHCHYGSDRTGAIVAMYRMVWQGWSRADAIDEMQHGGYGFHPVWSNLIHYLDTVDIAAMRAAAQARIAAGQD